MDFWMKPAYKCNVCDRFETYLHFFLNWILEIWWRRGGTNIFTLNLGQTPKSISNWKQIVCPEMFTYLITTFNNSLNFIILYNKGALYVNKASDHSVCEPCWSILFLSSESRNVIKPPSYKCMVCSWTVLYQCQYVFVIWCFFHAGGAFT